MPTTSHNAPTPAGLSLRGGHQPYWCGPLAGSRRLFAVQDQIGGTPRHCHNGTVEVAGQHDWHGRAIHDAQPVDAADPQLVVDDVIVARAHRATADRVIAAVT